ncbi:hypothetical protein K523DRAFT_159885 [Schizophyllum commune Tattone D]|nr:hypothetical protein K523DRAFT_159885 [Schizophyllum commune Tattone D]
MWNETFTNISKTIIIQYLNSSDLDISIAGVQFTASVHMIKLGTYSRLTALKWCTICYDRTSKLIVIRQLVSSIPR